MTAEEKSVLSLFMIGVLIVVGKVLAGGEPITPRLFIGRMLLGGFVSMVAGVVLVQFAEFSISLATGRADIYTETPVKVSGFKRVIDEQDWTITKVTHFLNNSGFTTSLELEVRLSDVEYETEDDE